MADQTSTATERADIQLKPFIVALRPWLLKRARKISKNEADAEDLVQEASRKFLVTFSGQKRLPAEEALVGWLIVVMMNDFTTLCRERKFVKQGVMDPTFLERTTMGQPSEPTRLSDTVSAETFDAAMKQLSPALRTTMELSLSDKSYQEISAALRIPVGTVGKRLSDARKKLLRFLLPLLPFGAH